MLLYRYFICEIIYITLPETFYHRCPRARVFILLFSSSWGPWDAEDSGVLARQHLPPALGPCVIVDPVTAAFTSPSAVLYACIRRRRTPQDVCRHHLTNSRALHLGSLATPRPNVNADAPYPYPNPRAPHWARDGLPMYSHPRLRSCPRCLMLVCCSEATSTVGRAEWTSRLTTRCQRY